MYQHVPAGVTHKRVSAHVATGVTPPKKFNVPTTCKNISIRTVHLMITMKTLKKHHVPKCTNNETQSLIKKQGQSFGTGNLMINTMKMLKKYFMLEDVAMRRHSTRNFNLPKVRVTRCRTHSAKIFHNPTTFTNNRHWFQKIPNIFFRNR